MCSFISRKQRPTRNPPRIFIVHNILWTHYKAVIYSCLYNILVTNGYELLVVHIAINEEGRKSFGEIDLSMHKYPYRILFAKSIDRITWFAKASRLLKEVIHFRPNLVVLPGWDSPAYSFTALISKILSIKTVISVDSTELDHRRIIFKETIKKIILKLYDASFTYGTASTNYMQKLGMVSDRIFVKLNAVDKSAIENLYGKYGNNLKDLKKEYGFKPFNFIFVGRLSPEKNIPSLIKAFKNLKVTSPTAEMWGLIIVGDGPLLQELESMVKRDDIFDVYFVGGKPWNEAVLYYYLADVFVLPSVSEPWGLVVNEAMICGLPVIVSNKAGASFDLIKEGENGFTFEPTDIGMLTNIMRKFVDGELDIEKMGANSKEIIKSYTPENVAAKMFESIKTLLGGV